MRRPKAPKPPPRPYDLATIDDRLACRGEPRLLLSLGHYPGAIAHGDPLAPGAFVTLPQERAAVMALEALATPASVSDSYRQRRAELMTMPQAYAAAVQTLNRAGVKLRRPPWRHQLEFVGFALDKRGVYNASEQGTGKTAACWLALLAWGLGRGALIVTKSSLEGEWVQELEATVANQPLAVEVLGTGMALSWRRARLEEIAHDWRRHGDARVVILNYEVLADLAGAVADWGPTTIIGDEAWKLKGDEAKVTEAMTLLSRLPTTRHALLAAGTPIGNDVGDLYAQLRIVDPTWSVYTPWEFRQAYCEFETVRTRHGHGMLQKPIGCRDPAGLMRRLDPLWYRVPKEACLDLPPLERHVIKLDMPAETRLIYDQLREGGVATLGQLTGRSDQRIELLLQQRMTSGFEPTWTDEPRSWALRPLPCPKLEWVTQFARGYLADSPEVRCVVWCRFHAELRRVAGALEELLGAERVAKAIGDTSAQELDRIKASFNSRDPEGVQVIVTQNDKLCAGHNLQAGDHHIIFSNTWSWLTRSQLESRSHRGGRVGTVHLWDLIIKRSVDEVIHAALQRKEDMAELVAVDTVGGESTLQHDLGELTIRG